MLSLQESITVAVIRLSLALLIFALIWLMRGLLVRIARRLLRRVSPRPDAPLDVALRELIGLPVRLLVFALAVHISARVLELEPDLQLAVYRITRSLVVIALLVALVRISGALLESRQLLASVTHVDVPDRVVPTLRTGIQLVVVAIGLVLLVQVWGYDITGLVAGLGLGGLAISLAAQDTLANLFGFSMIVGDNPFGIGDAIKTPDVEGNVERVGMRSTRVRQYNQALVTVPNSKLASSAILNWSRLQKRRYEFTLRLQYGATADQLEALLARLRALLSGNPAVEPGSVVVHFVNFGENALEILVRADVRTPDWLEFTREQETMNLAVLRAVAAEGLTIAVPARALTLERLDPASLLARTRASAERGADGASFQDGAPSTGDPS